MKIKKIAEVFLIDESLVHVRRNKIWYKATSARLDESEFQRELEGEYKRQTEETEILKRAICKKKSNLEE